MSKRKYYTDDIGSLYCVDNEQVYIYNYSKKNFILTPLAVDIMGWNEVPEKKLNEYTKSSRI